MILGTTEKAIGRPTEQPMVRIAELEIDADQLTAYTAALKEEISTSVRAEPGVLALCAVAVKDHPTNSNLRDVCRPRRVRIAFANSTLQKIQDRNCEDGEVPEARRNRPDSPRHEVNANSW
jgi:hypothetical protein